MAENRTKDIWNDDDGEQEESRRERHLLRNFLIFLLVLAAVLYGIIFGFTDGLVGVFNCLLVLVIRPLFLLLYNVTPETYEAAYTIIGVLACLQLVLGIDVTCIVGILRGGGDTRTAFVYDCGALWLVSIPMGILAGLVLHLPVPLVYVCLKLDSPIKAFLSLLRIRSGKWIRNVTVQTSPMPPEEEAQRAAGME